MKKFFISIISVILLFLGITGISYAWLTIQTRLDTPLAGSIFTNYFHCGSGEENDPYVITRPQHLYNLTMLYQHLNGFDEDPVYIQIGYDLDNDGELEVYGENNTLDMSAYTDFVPIGTYNHMFKGILNGNGFIIDNLTIVGQSEQDVGIFGYVTDEASISDIYFDNLTVDISNCSGSSYVGYIAGYIEDATCFENVYINNCELCGTASTFQSDWGYFGHCVNVEQDLNLFINKAIGTNEGNDWGGSIDMKSLNVRLYNHLNDLTHTSYSTNGYYGKYINTYSNISVVRGDKAKTYYTRNPLTTQTFYNLMGNGNHTYKENYTLPGTYIPLLENADGSVPDKNTGYIVSDSQAMNNANGTVRSASYQMRYIANSLVGTKATDAQVYSGTGSAASVSFNANNLEILTNKGTTYSSSNYYLIKDSYNQNHSVTNAAISSFTKSDATTPENLGLKKYNASREALDAVLTDQSFIHGIHFMGTAISQNTTLTIPTAVINGETKTNYVVPKSCIDFNLKEDGIINFFGGSYYARTNSSYADSFFSLNYITRNAQDGITSIKQINNIYLNTNTADGQPKYVYQFSDNTYSTGTRGELVFNMSFIMNEPPARNALYYFEIPVNAGEYALGTVSGKSGGGYLMYLDIGASGTESVEEEADDFGSVEYRSNPDTVDHSILILRYNQSNSLTFSIKVIFDKNTDTYEIITSENITITVAILDTGYTYIFNDEDIGNTIGTQNKT